MDALSARGLCTAACAGAAVVRERPHAPEELRDPDRDPEVQALLRLAMIDGVGPRRLRAAVRELGSARVLLAADADRRRRALGVEHAEPGPRERVARLLARCREHRVQVVGWHDRRYPPRLLHLTDPPPVLYVLGDIEHLHARQVAVVGSRRATAYGRRTARALSRALAEKGIVVLSGMALGVDGEAHRGALEAGGVSTAVLASGPERASPRRHRALYRALRERGAVASEHPPRTPSLGHHFPVRNRLMAALAAAVVVVEASKKSGALITAREANDMGRAILAVPGPVDSATSRGTNQLLVDGATPALGVQSILDAVGSMGPFAERGVHAQIGLALELSATELGEDAARLWKVLTAAPASIEHLARASELTVPRALAALTRLEVGGWVCQEPGLNFGRAQGGWDHTLPRILPKSPDS